MSKEQIQLFELANSPFGLVISPMLNSFIPTDELTTAFQAHRHYYYSVFVLERGYIEIKVDSKQITMNESSMLLINPSQVHQCINMNDISGWVMFFDGKCLDPNARAVLEQSIEKIQYFNLSDKELSFFTYLLASIYDITEDKKPGMFQLQLLHSLINALFYQAANLYKSLEQQMAQKYSVRSVEITQSFKNLVKEHFLVLKKPSDYAFKMNVSVSYLNDTIKAVTGFSSTYFLQQEIIGEAQRQLLYTSKTVKEIAFLLGYDDYKYFIRLFTKIVSIPPLQFRKAKQAFEFQK